MKTLKKTLCLVLAVVMVVGVLILPASAATYPDDDEIQYKEAVEVLSGLGILGGKDDGTFDPKGTLTRAEGAKIISFLAQTPEVAEDYVSSTGAFTDVPANNWAMSSIAYCVSKGIIGGTPTGFDPTGKLTGHAFAKMLLCALGYDAVTEGYVGSGWDTSVENRAREIKLNAGITALDFSENITREQACQMALNALQARKATYSGGTEMTLPDGTSIKVGANLNNTTTAVFGVDVYGLHKSTEATEATTSDEPFGRPVSGGWYIGDNAEDPDSYIYKVPVNPTKKYTAPVNGKTLYSDLGLRADISAATVYVDGKPGDTKAISKNDTATVFGGNGTLTEVYYDKTADTATVVIINTYLDSVADVVSATATAPAYVVLGSKLTYDVGTLAKGDAVLVTKAYDEDSDSYYAVSVKKVAPTTIHPVSFTASTVTADGKTYSYNATTDAGAYYNDANFGARDAYVDENGYIIGFVYVAPGAPTYAVVLDYQDAGTWQSSTNVRSAKLLLADGSVVTVTASLPSGKTWGGVTAAGVTVNEVVRYNIINDVYVLTDLGGEAVSVSNSWNNVKIAKNGATIHMEDTSTHGSGHTGCKTFLTDSKTVFLVSNGNGFDVYNGIAAVPSMTLTASSDPAKKPVIAVATDSDNGHAAVVFVIGRTLVASSIQDVIVLVKAGVEVHEPNRVYTPYTAVVNGAITTVNVAKGTTGLTPGKLYTSVVYDANGDVAGATELAIDTNLGFLTGAGYDSASGSVITLYGLDGKLANGDEVEGKQRYAYDANTKVFLINGTTVKAVSMTELGASATNTTQVLMNGNVISELYVTVANSLTLSGATSVPTVGAGETIDASSQTLTVEGDLQKGAKVSTSDPSKVVVNGNCMEAVELTEAKGVSTMSPGVVFETSGTAKPTGGISDYNNTHKSITVVYKPTSVTLANEDKVKIEIYVNDVLKGTEEHTSLQGKTGVWAFCPLAPGSDTKGPDGTGTMAALEAGDYVTVKITFTDNDGNSSSEKVYVITCGFTVSAD